MKMIFGFGGCSGLPLVGIWLSRKHLIKKGYKLKILVACPVPTVRLWWINSWPYLFISTPTQRKALKCTTQPIIK